MQQPAEHIRLLGNAGRHRAICRTQRVGSSAGLPSCPPGPACRVMRGVPSHEQIAARSVRLPLGALVRSGLMLCAQRRLRVGAR